MKHTLFLLLFFAGENAFAQMPTRKSVAEAGNMLHDVMEITDTTRLREQIITAEKDTVNTVLSKLRLGILLHEGALNFNRLVINGEKGYAAKSFSILDSLCRNSLLSAPFLPFAESYRASALALTAGENNSLSQLNMAFELFGKAVANYAEVCAMPEFLRGSVAENLPGWMFRKTRFAKTDFTRIISRYEADSSYATPKIMSFCYWAWANKHRKGRHKATAIRYLDIAISLDPKGEAGKPKAEKLKRELTGH